MNLIAHVTPHELPLWIAALVAGVVLGISLALAAVRHFGRKD